MRYLCSVMVLLAAACSGATDPSETNLEANLALWTAAGPASYSMVVTPSCFCGNQGAVRIVVQNRAVVSRTAVVSGQAPPAGQVQLYPDVPGLFDVIRDALDRRARSIFVTYDQALGYPRSISIDYQGNVTDDELVLVVSEFQAAP